MKAYPIIFSPAMVQALLSGRKTQTRRVITSQWFNAKMHFEDNHKVVFWVRETFRDTANIAAENRKGLSSKRYQYIADGRIEGLKYTPCIHMPSAASRLVLEITGARTEPLQDISRRDAILEGFKCQSKDGRLIKYGIPDNDGLPGTDNYGWPWQEWEEDPRQAYQRLWEKLHGAGSWDENPSVFVFDFKVHKANVLDFALKGAA